jgi:hypothetical protein
MLQVQLNNTIGRAAQTPPPDERIYFLRKRFDAADALYDPLPSDSENELHLITFGRRKVKAWPRTDPGFEHEKAKVHKRIV